MDDLPELPFEKVLSCLSLEDRLKARAVSRRWYHTINRFNVKSLCYSDRPAGFIEGKRRLVSGAFAQNFISSTRFESFCNTFRPTILSNLKHLRLCDLRLNAKNLPAFVSTLQSFGQLEELDIIRFDCRASSAELTLPMLTSIQLENLLGIEKLTLDAPRLLKIKLDCFWLRLELVHAESVEWFMADEPTAIAVKNMKNLKYLFLNANIHEFYSTSILSSFKQLKEIHLGNFDKAGQLLKNFFELKQRHGRTNLQIYLCGLLLNGPDDPAVHSLLRDVVMSNSFSEEDSEAFGCLTEDPSRLADQIPFWPCLSYAAIEQVATGTRMSIVKKFTDLKWIEMSVPVEDIERFLNLLKNLDIVGLNFECDQPQDLFDRLPEHCTVQRLIIHRAPSDIRFLFRLQHLMKLRVDCSIDAEEIRKVFDANEFLSEFSFMYLDKILSRYKISRFYIQITPLYQYIKQFRVSVDYGGSDVPDLDAAIEFITSGSRPSYRTARPLLW